ncbi:MAG TPA: hypothetical protein PKW79_06630, partial [Rhabdochlamydiaceae bacterium]|nr:hypothetical protein [Rhabdochlamydiaceae bacterium]
HILYDQTRRTPIVIPVINNIQTLLAHSRSQLGYDKVDLKFAWPMWITLQLCWRRLWILC